MVKKNSMVDNISMTLTGVGGLNWGLIGIGNLFRSDWNLVTLIFGNYPILVNVVYVSVGAGAVYLIGKSFKWWK